MNHHKSGQQGPADEASSGRNDLSTGKTQGQQPAADLSDARVSNKDILPILRGWDYEPGTINVRKVSGLDGRPKLQMRLDLGLLQMEMTGRPDGQEPFGCESLLDYHEKKLDDHQRRHGTDMGFAVSSDDCQSLREEAVMYYQRYLSLFVLEEFAGVVRDTARNLRLLDLCSKFASEEEDRLVLEQYRPYITMMNARAKASIQLKTKRYKEAIREIDLGIGQIREFFERIGRPEAMSHANEIKVLKRFAKEIKKKIPVEPAERLQRKLDKAIKAERYEAAAKLRDKLAAIKGEKAGPPSAQA